MQPDAPFVVHDLRRTVSTGMNALGIQPAHVEAVLNHRDGVRASVAGVYNQHHYVPEKTAALVRWADHVSNLIEGKAAKILPMKRKARAAIV
jgi:hypothetical protein